MKTKILLMVFLILCMIAADEMPPALPASFYGLCNTRAGAVVMISVMDYKTHVSCFNWEGQSVYFVDIPEQIDGSMIVFKIGRRIVATAEWHSGINMELNLIPRK